MTAMSNPTGRHWPKHRHPGEGTVVRRKDRWRSKPWAAVVPYIDASGRRRQTWLSAASRAEAERGQDAGRNDGSGEAARRGDGLEIASTILR